MGLRTTCHFVRVRQNSRFSLKYLEMSRGLVKDDQFYCQKNIAGNCPGVLIKTSIGGLKLTNAETCKNTTSPLFDTCGGNVDMVHVKCTDLNI